MAYFVSDIKSKRILAFFLLSLLILSYILIVPVHVAEAAALTSVSDTMSSSKINATSTHAIRFTTPTGVADNTDTVIITFPSDFDFTGKATSSLTLTHGVTTGAETTETIGTPTVANWSAAFSGTEDRILTLTTPTDGIGVSAIAAGEKVIVGYSAASSTNPSAPGSYELGITGAFSDTGSTTIQILNDDQVAITATVPQSLTFSIDDNSASFGVLSAGASRYASGTAAGDPLEVQAHNLIVGTNAANGYSMTINGPTLTSGANTITAIGAANTAPSIGTEQFGLRLTSTGGSGLPFAPYAASGFAFDTASFPDVVASSTVSSSNTTYSARYLANITSNTEAGAYSTTLTYTATANF